MSFLRPNKADIERYKQTIRDYKAAKVTAVDGIREYKWAWKEVCREHFRKLRLDLKHIADRPLIDSLEADAIDGETLFNTESYFRHYEDRELSSIALEVSCAKAGLKTIEAKLKAEQARRNKA
ncbi:MAG: hypothetical protein IJH81_06030 [Lachnospiraceae bacterium]|nr:hypothetical protein [Lachnospiraceae bacterium]